MSKLIKKLDEATSKEKIKNIDQAIIMLMDMSTLKRHKDDSNEESFNNEFLRSVKEIVNPENI